MVGIGLQGVFKITQNQPRHTSNKVFFVRFEMPCLDVAKLFPVFKIMGAVKGAIPIFEQTARI